MDKAKIDLIDRKILTELDINCRISNTELGKKFHKSREAIKYRIKKLEDDGILTGYITSINPNKIGYKMFKVYLKLDNIPGERRRFYNFLKSQINVYWLGICDGAYDCVFAVLAKTIEEYYSEINRILAKFKSLIVERIFGVMVDTLQFNKKYLLENSPKKVVKFGGDTENVGLDNLDFEVLSSMANNARISYANLSNKLNVPTEIIKEKIERLKNQKVILSNRIDLDINKLNLQFYKIFIYTKSLSAEDEWMLIDWVTQHPNFIYYIRSIAPWQIELELIVKDYQEFNKIMNELREEFPQIIKYYKHLLMIDEFWLPAYKDILDYAKEFEKDTYILNKEAYLNYRMFKDDAVIDFNHASLTRPYKSVFNLINSNKKIEDQTDLARKYAAEIINLKDQRRVIFGRNTTEAISFIYWLANVENETVICSDAENKSVTRIFKEHRDHGNTNRLDGWSTFSDDVISEEFGGVEAKKQTKTRLKIIPLLETDNINEFINHINERTKLVVISHVIRNDGQILDIEKITKKIKKKNPNIFIAIDGAQALGNLNKVDFEHLEKIGVDFYAATPHKTMGAYPLGILYFSKRAENNIQMLNNLKKEEQILIEGMIDKSYKIKNNVENNLSKNRIASFVEAIKYLKKNNWLNKNDFSKKVNYQKNLVEYFISKIVKYNVHLEQRRYLDYSNAIVSFKFIDKDSSKIVKLLQKENIFCSYISETNNLRVSFDITNTKKQIDHFFKVLDSLA